MDSNLLFIKNKIYDKCDLKISHIKIEAESKAYNAAQFRINGKKIIYRTAKITPKKIGQFVTFWVRNTQGIIRPFSENDAFDYFVINVRTHIKLGQFVIPKTHLIKQGIVSSKNKSGKRGLRVYPQWDVVKSDQAKKTQMWQQQFFYQISDKLNTATVLNLYGIK